VAAKRVQRSSRTLSRLGRKLHALAESLAAAAAASGDPSMLLEVQALRRRDDMAADVGTPSASDANSRADSRWFSLSAR